MFISGGHFLSLVDIVYLEWTLPISNGHYLSRVNISYIEWTLSTSSGHCLPRVDIVYLWWTLSTASGHCLSRVDIVEVIACECGSVCVCVFVCSDTNRLSEPPPTIRCPGVFSWYTEINGAPPHICSLFPEHVMLHASFSWALEAVIARPQ